MEDLITSMLEQKVWVVAGSFRSEEKWAYKIYRKLKQKGYTVYALNKAIKEVDGDPTYPELKDLPQVPQVINLVTPPEVSRKLVDESKSIGIDYVWFQPGAESAEAVEAAEKAGLKVLHNACVYALHN
ncbi:CoA-binding protein [Heliobacterium undosum]|uniref:CoA-binding protein n=1 Tax=Heliomicrobium undosum TaxID=121734 RepID=A0A845KZI7_9FIRM|nr:CoA-binding protein [Heliomicrobium undosum]MZP29183.1 CoA-binding protein [Heliomicrobium undosum]